MYQDIMNRPMFQTPQQRQGGGIMAGVAPTTPVRGYEEGGFLDSAQEYAGDLLSDDFASMEQTEEGSGINARDLTDVFIVDYEDPIDVSMSAATVGLLGFPPAAAAAALARMGYKGKKVFDKVQKLSEMQQGLNRSNQVELDAIKPGAGIVEAYGKMQAGRLAGEPAMILRDAEEDPEGFYNGGIALIPRFGRGGVVLEKFIELAQVAGTKGMEAIEELTDSFRKGDITGDQFDELAKIAQNPPKVPKMDAGDLSAPDVLIEPKTTSKESFPELGLDIKGPPKSPEVPTKVKMDAADLDAPTTKIGEIKPSKPSIFTAPLRNPVKTALAGGAAAGASDIFTGTNYVGDTIDATSDAYQDFMDVPEIRAATGRDNILSSVLDKAGGAIDSVTSGYSDEIEALRNVPEIRAIAKSIPFNSVPTQEENDKRLMSESAFNRREEAAKAREEGFPVDPSTITRQGPPLPPEKTGLMKFLFGKDGVGGEPGFAGNALAELQDPRMQYALNKAAQPSEGFVPRNFFSDVAEGQMEYDIQKAKLDQLEDSQKTALMKNFETLRGMYPEEISDQAIINSLLTKDSARSDFISLFGDAYESGLTGPDEIKKIIAATGYQPDAAQMAALGIGAPVSADVK